MKIKNNLIVSLLVITSLHGSDIARYQGLNGSRIVYKATEYMEESGEAFSAVGVTSKPLRGSLVEGFGLQVKDDLKNKDMFSYKVENIDESNSKSFNQKNNLEEFFDLRSYLKEFAVGPRRRVLLNTEDIDHIRFLLTAFILSDSLKCKELPSWLQKGLVRDENKNLQEVAIVNNTLEYIQNNFSKSKYFELLADFLVRYTGGYRYCVKGQSLAKNLELNRDMSIQKCLQEYSQQLQENDGETRLIHLIKYSKTVEDIYSQMDHDIKSGIGINVQDVHTNTPLMVAASAGRIDVVKRLVEAGAELGIVNSIGSTALHWATSKGHLEVTKYLIKAGAKVDVQNKYGYTPFLGAASNNQSDIIKFFVREQEINLDTQTQTGKTAFQFARDYRNEEIMEILMKAVEKKVTHNDDELVSALDNESVTLDSRRVEQKSCSSSYSWTGFGCSIQ